MCKERFSTQFLVQSHLDEVQIHSLLNEAGIAEASTLKSSEELIDWINKWTNKYNQFKISNASTMPEVSDSV